MVVEVRSSSRISGQTSQDERDGHARQRCGQDGAGAPLMRLVGEAVQEADGDRFDLLGFNCGGDVVHRRLVERQQHGAVGGHAFGHAEAQVARHQRLRAAPYRCRTARSDAPRRISRESRKPSVVTSAVRAPLRSISALVASVVPWTTSADLRRPGTWPRPGWSASPSITPRSGASGVGQDLDGWALSPRSRHDVGERSADIDGQDDQT